MPVAVQARDGVRRRVRTEECQRRIAGHQVNEQEDERRQPQSHGDELEQAAHQVGRHDGMD